MAYAIIHVESGLVYGTGETEAQAWSQYESVMRHIGEDTSHDGHACRECSQAFVDAVVSGGGSLAYRKVGGVLEPA